MKSNFKKVLNKYFLLKNSFLKDLRIRKQKVKSIWNKAYALKKNKSIKNKNIEKLQNFISEIDLKKYNLFKKFKIQTTQNISSKKGETLDKTKSIERFKKLYKKSFNNLLQIYKTSPEIFRNYFKSNQSKIKFKKIEKIFDKYLNIKTLKFIKVFYKNNLKKTSFKGTRSNDFLGIYYANNNLTITHLQKINNSNIIKDFVKINAPTDLIGEYKVEKGVEVTRIINDVINIFELNYPPIILFLSSSFFTTRSFNDRELVIFSEEDPLILSKSPFLPGETLIQYKRVSGDKNTSFHRVIYANKNVIDSWINVLSLTGCDIATVTCPAIHDIEKITNKSKGEVSVVCDIEDFITTVYIIRRNCELFSSRLPFGSSVYITGKDSLNDQFFSRLKNSVKSIISDNSLRFDDNIYLTGNGLDKMLSKNNIINEGFLKVPRNKFKFEKQEESIFNNESILSSFSDKLDILIRKGFVDMKADEKQQIYRGQKYKQKKEENKVPKKKQNLSTFKGRDKKLD